MPTVAALVTDDLESMGTAIDGLPLRARRMAPGGGSISLVHVATDSLSLTAGRFGFPIATEGTVGDDVITVGLPLEGGAGTWNGNDFGSNDLWCYGSGSEHVGSSPDPPAFAVLTLDASHADRWSDLEAPMPVLRRGRHRVVRSRAKNRLVRDIADIVELARTGVVSTRQAAALEHDLLVTLADVLSAGEVHDQIRRDSALWIVREAEARTAVRGPMPSATEIAADLDVSDRWVRAAFRRIHGVSMSTYFRSRALHYAHEDLRRAGSGSATVTDVAMRWGFWHLGRFSDLYRSYFDELPSETLARAA